MANDEYVPPADEADRKVWRAVNYFDECSDIVRRLIELGSIGDRALMYQLVEDAAKLWAKMQKEAGDE